MKKLKVDKPFLISSIILIISGFLIFSSSSLGLYGKDGSRVSSIFFNQVVFGLIGGLIALFFASRFNYKNWRKYSFYIFIFSIVLTALVFVPSLGLKHAGATRWIEVANFSFQPSEFLKIAFIMYFATWLSSVKSKVRTFKFGLLPFILLLGVCGIILLLQPDTDTFAIIFISGLTMFLVAGAKIRDLFFIVLASVLGLLLLATLRPYVMDRITTFLDPSIDPLGSSYQIQQSLIAVGSGGIFGRGFGQSVQKFQFLPEHMGDSIFAVAAEEFGFLGSVILLFLYVFFGFFGFKIAIKSPDLFSRLMVSGIVILIVSQSFINISGMLGVLPLSGIPLLFVSHGGTALLITLFEVGIILNISKYKI